MHSSLQPETVVVAMKVPDVLAVTMGVEEFTAPVHWVFPPGRPASRRSEVPSQMAVSAPRLKEEAFK